MAVRIGVSFVRDEKGGRTYLAALRAAGAEPVVLATSETLPQWPTAEQAETIFSPDNPSIRQIDDLDGLLFTGGGDIDPMLYHERLAGGAIPHWPRDHVETEQFLRARARNLPIFGICRGHQLVNVALGGSLIQDVPFADNHRRAGWGSSASHLVQVTGDSVLGRIIAEGQPDRDMIVGVNSYHHQGVSPQRLAPGLIAVVSSNAEPDGGLQLVEGFESEGTREGREYVVGVQWHPERVDDEAPLGPGQPMAFREISRRLFRAFAAAAEAARSRDERRNLMALQV